MSAWVVKIARWRTGLQMRSRRWCREELLDRLRIGPPTCRSRRPPIAAGPRERKSPRTTGSFAWRLAAPRERSLLGSRGDCRVTGARVVWGAPGTSVTSRTRRPGSGWPVERKPPSADSVLSRRRFLAPLALAQFICSFAGSNMNVMINDITEDLDTTVAGRAGDDHAVPADHGDPHDPLQQADRPLGPQALLHRRPRAVRDRRPAERGLAGTRRADPRQLGAGGRRHGAADPARLHPHDAALQRPHVARPGLRRHQRAGRHRRRRRTADRRRHHDRRSAGAPRSSSRPRSSRRSSCSAAGSSDPLPADPTRPFDAVGAILSAVGMFFVVFGILQADNDVALMAVLLVAGAAFLIWFFLYIRARERAGQGAAAVHRPVQEPHVEPRPRHAEHPVAAADGVVVHRRRSSSRPSAATTPSRRASSSRPRRSACWSRRSPRSDSPSGARRRR